MTGCGRDRSEEEPEPKRPKRELESEDRSHFLLHSGAVVAGQ